MKAVILAGGLGTRLSEETDLKPKPMVEVGGKPILWHLMKIYSAQGVNDFVICCGYKGYVIKEYFANYFLHMSDVSISVRENLLEARSQRAEPWKVTLVDTGEHSMTGGRLKRVSEYIRDDDCFCFTYGDGIGNIDICKLVAYHKSHGRLATLTATCPPGRFGALEINDKQMVKRFAERSQVASSMINGGFFVLSPQVLQYIEDDTTVWEQQPLKKLALHRQLMAYEHNGFWQPMDTIRDKLYLEQLWKSDDAPWRVWV